MNETQSNVKQFMLAFGQECPEKPTIPPLEVRKLRAKLILEETWETIAALGFNAKLEAEYEPDLVAIADGLADLSYVLYGTALSCGLNMEPIEKEVHRSNMSKMWSEEDREQSSEWLRNTHVTILGTGTKLWLVKDSSGKVLKSSSYSPANIQPLIDAQSK